MLAATVGSGKQSVLAVEGERSDGALDDVVVDFDPAILEEERKPSPAGQRVADRLGGLCFLADQRQLLAQPRLQRLDQRAAALLPQVAALVGEPASTSNP